MSDIQEPPLASTSVTASSSSSSDSEIDAFLAWAQAVLADIPDADKQVTTPADLSDGVALFQILSDIERRSLPQSSCRRHKGQLDPHHRHAQATVQARDAILLSESAMRTYSAAGSGPERDSSLRRSCRARQAVSSRHGIAVQSEKNEVHIAAIQTLDQAHQHQLMMSIEHIMSLITQGQQEQQEASLADDSIASSTVDTQSDSIDVKHHGKSTAQLAGELEAVQLQKDDVDKSYLLLLEAHRELKNQFQDLQTEKEELATAHEAQKKLVEQESTGQADVLMQQEIDRLKNDLRRSEDALAELETDNDKLLQSSEEAKRRIEELQKSAEEVTKLKDQIEEYRHAAIDFKRRRTPLRSTRRSSKKVPMSGDS